ncbi:phosphoglycerate kinase [Candidatus Pelagibacter sp. HIMB1321]|uniref:phosphoglycerate kinase n=1 Tax=Candidatus Pelagibacter sp. HIMB1321 TaxID=1388755 RepID=UPI000A07FB4B|nr:phosphoglycerate kinase [Candidatus Pelagibacter sp. HIMB1321]SMF79250.1 phosphoglycerate kinase [Candidatus Pelagibacter sp. HIMB1321]
MKNIENQKNLLGKRVLLRLDLNVPLQDGIIQDETRISKILPTLKFLIQKQAKIIIISHAGRPKGKIVPALSLKLICTNLSEKLNQKINLITDDIRKIENKDLFKNIDGNILVLENIRFYPEEENNDSNFSQHLASFADVYINDAFSCSHRAHASVTSITKFLPSYCGLQFNSEVTALKKVTSEIEKPISCIIGGSKISTKIGIIKNLIPKFDNIIIVGGMANNILSYKNVKIGKSIHEENCNEIVKNIFETSKQYSCSIIYPEDVITSKSLDGKPEPKKLNDISDDDMILDIGEKTIKKIDNLINSSKTILWNGPAGYFENNDFANGSFQIAKSIVKNHKSNSIYSVAGGGDTISVLNKINAINDFNFISTAGGAFLEYLEGKEIPGISALN